MSDQSWSAVEPEPQAVMMPRLLEYFPEGAYVPQKDDGQDDAPSILGGLSMT